MGIYGWGLLDSGIPHNERTANWLYRSKLFAFDLGGYSTWAAIEGEPGQLNGARNWLAQNPGGTYCYTVCMLPGYKSTPASGTSLANGAAGLYDVHFATLAGKLVAKNLANNTIVRIGHEFNGNWYPWKVLNATDAVHYANYWKKIVDAMRAVPGAENLKFEWCGIAQTSTSYPISQAYPGDAYVDYIGCDAYDACYYANTYEDPYPNLTPSVLQQRRNQAWNYISGTSFNGMATWRDFAASRGKPFTIPEWGSSDSDRGGEDNPVYIQKMYDFIHEPSNNVYYHSYFDVQAGDGHHQLTQLPNGTATQFPTAAALFRTLFGMKPFPLNQDIGATGPAGSSSVVTFKGAGTGFLPTVTTDSFNLSSRTITGDDELLVKVQSVSTSATAQSGVMLRQSTADNSAYAALFIANGQCVFQSRATAGAKALQTSVINSVTAPAWLKLDRKGDLVTGYLSFDGLNWILAGSRTIAMTGTAHLGLAVTSGSTASLATATIAEVDYVDIQTNDTAAIGASTILDNTAPSGVTVTGTWNPSTNLEFQGTDYLDDGNSGKGTKSVRFSPALSAAGRYDVFIRWPAAYNRADNVPTSVTSPAGTVSFLANQQIGRSLWNHLGAYEFTAGSAGNVLVTNTGTIYNTAADAVMFVKRPEPVSVAASADAYVRDGTYAAINYGTVNILDVKKDATSYNRDAFLRYNVASLAGSGLVQLQLTPTIVNTSTTATFTIEFVANDTWTETGVTWNTKPAGSGVVLGQLQLSGLQVGVPVNIDITDQVLAEAAGDGMISIRIRPEVAGSLTNVTFASREHATASYRPQLLAQ